MEDLLFIITEDTSSELSPALKEQVALLRSRGVKVVVISLAGNLDSTKELASGDDLAIIPAPGRERLIVSRVPWLLSRGTEI